MADDMMTLKAAHTAVARTPVGSRRGAIGRANRPARPVRRTLRAREIVANALCEKAQPPGACLPSTWTIAIAIVGPLAVPFVPTGVAEHASLAARAGYQAKEKASGKIADVPPPEDLMREHGVLNRVLLIYEAALNKFANDERFNPQIITNSAQVVRQFIERYHEHNEETQLFPRFRAVGQMTDLVDVLYQQHQAGRRLTVTILGFSSRGYASADDRESLERAMRGFIRMYRAHESREDTELFPKLRQIMSANEFDAMGDDFEKDERKRFGEDGFASMVERVSGLERAVGINELASYTATE